MARLKMLRPQVQTLGTAVARTPWQPGPLTPKRRSGRWLQRQREALFRREPLCRECRKHDRVTAATIRDHIVPLAEGGKDEDSNIQPLCQACSDAKTHRESARGRTGGA